MNNDAFPTEELPVSPPSAGLFPGYRIVQELGRGGMGVVYLAEEVSSGRPAALKAILPEKAGSARARRNFRDEAEWLKPLHHDNLVALLDVGETDHLQLFFTTEFCAGGCLQRYVKSNGPLAIEESLRYTAEILAGLAYAHAAALPAVKTTEGFQPATGLVHRDLKPANVFLAETADGWRAKVGDFGLAKSFETAGMTDRTVSGSVSGSFPFMCRQQLLDFRYAKPEVDVFAVAGTLYFLLTGHAPRSFHDVHPAMTYKKYEKPPAPIRSLRADVPEDLATVIDAALDDTGDLRFQSADELRDALKLPPR